MSERMILLNPGPVCLSGRVRNALARADWCHREPEFAALTRDILERLTHVYPQGADDYDAVLLTGSGTSAVEAMLATLAPGDGATLVLRNGVYGDRMATMLERQGKPHVSLGQDWQAPLDLGRIEQCLVSRPEISHVAVVHHETTTGRLNDLDGLGELCRELDRQLLLDAVSSFGAEAIDFSTWNLAALAATANKCLHGAPGLSFVLAHRECWERPATPASVYLDLHRYHELQSGSGYSPFTQAVHVAFALQAALEEFEEEGGWRTRHEIYGTRADRIGDTLPGSVSRPCWSRMPTPWFSGPTGFRQVPTTLIFTPR